MRTDRRTFLKHSAAAGLAAGAAACGNGGASTTAEAQADILGPGADPRAASR